MPDITLNYTVGTVDPPEPPPAGDDVGTMSISLFRMDGTAQDTTTGDFSSPLVCSAPEAIRFEARVLSATGLPVLSNGFDREGNVLPDALYSYTHPDGAFEYDQQMHELEFVWSFGGTSGLFDAVPRLPDFMRQKAVSHGRFTEHVFETAGTHAVTCEAWRVDYSGGTQTAVLVARKTINVVIRDALAPYTGSGAIICINPDFPPGHTADANAADSAAPVGSVGYPDIDTFRADWGSRYGGVQRIVLFRRGKTHLFNNQWRSGESNLTWAAYGTGAKPIFGLGPSHNLNGANIIDNQGSATPKGYWRFVDLDVRGDWDSFNETGDLVTFCRPFQPTNVALINCEFTDMQQVVYNGSSTAVDGDHSLILFNTAIKGWQDYGVRGGSVGLWFGVRGSLIRQALDAAGNARGFKNTNTPHNWHGPMRFGYVKVAHVESSDIYSRSSWSGGAQPCIRVGTNNEFNQTTMTDENTAYFSLLVLRSIFEGGSIAVSMSTENGDNRLKPANCLVKHNIHLFDYNSGSFAVVARGATSVIENVLVAPAIGRARWQQSSRSFIRQDRNTLANDGSGQTRQLDDGSGPIPLVPENRQMPVRIIGNTVLDSKPPRTDDDRLDYQTFAAFTGLVEIRDNTRFAPQNTPPDTASGPMETAITITSYNTSPPRFFNPDLGQYVVFDGVDEQGLPYNTPGGAVTVLRPQTGAGVDGAATGAMSREDVLGETRPADAASGAVEPSA